MKLSVTVGVKYGDEEPAVWKGACTNQIFASMEDEGPAEVTLVFENVTSLFRFADALKLRAYEINPLHEEVEQ